MTAWTKEQERRLTDMWPTHNAAEIAQLMGRSEGSIRSRAVALRLRKRPEWPQSRVDEIARRYPHERTDVIARDMRCTISQVYSQANKLGLHKSEEFMASQNSGRIQRGRTDPRMTATQFGKGHVPANKGLRRPGWAPGRMAETQFKKGEMRGAARHKYVPVGSTRISKDGYLERKTTDDPNLYPARRWRAIHRIVWESANGSIPAGHIVVFKRGMKTAIESEITLDRIECISRADNMRRNTIHRYPDEVRSTMRQLGWLNRKIKQAEDKSA